MTRKERQGRFQELRGRMRESLGRLLHSERLIAAGQRDQLVGLLRRRYGSARDEAERRVDRFVHRYRIGW